jgi:hypothetical protein
MSLSAAYRCPLWRTGVLGLLVLLAGGSPSPGAESADLTQFRERIEPLLVEYCYECHAAGVKKGGIDFEKLASSGDVLGKRDLWWAVLKNVRAGIMPPAKKPRPTPDELLVLEDWIKHRAFGIDPGQPDPGRVTLRRLNRIEYRNTIRDLMGIDFRTEEEFPPDDTGYGFDTIGDVLTVSPLLLEKYMQAAEVIVARAVPTVAKVVPERNYTGTQFRGSGDTGDNLSFAKAAKVSNTYKAAFKGHYRITLNLTVRGDFNFDPGRARLAFTVDNREVLKKEFGWENGKRFQFELTEAWTPGVHQLAFELEPLGDVSKKPTTVQMRLVSVDIAGPLEPEHLGRPRNFERFFTRDAPRAPAERTAYAREVLGRFARKAFRRPVDAHTIDRLTAIAEGVYQRPEKTFEQGIGQAIVAILASPRFLFRVEELSPGSAGRRVAEIDEFSLASRLSYFFWSTMPDEELLGLAERGELRKNLTSQVDRLLKDSRSKALIENFTGQWLETRDVDGITISERTVNGRDDGEQLALKKEIDEFQAKLAKQDEEAKKAKPGEKGKSATQGRRLSFFNRPRIELDGALRSAIRRETEMSFAYVVHENKSVLDLLDCDYTFLNDKLARLYGIPGVTGSEMRKVILPKGSPRGGLITQASMLVVTSNPTRTSPVKRGLFILENILGTPPPPPPADVPQLEASAKQFKTQPTLRTVLEAHRAKPLCASCHARMDPLGLSLENFNALGLWREKERNQPIDASAQLLTGESFHDVRELKRVLRQNHRLDFYRCLTEKLLTYALGRGLEYYDVETVDRIVEQLDREQGRFSSLLTGVIHSAPFQQRRNVSATESRTAGDSE